MTSFTNYIDRIERLKDDGMFFARMGGNALRDADLILVTLSQTMPFEDIHDTTKRERLIRFREEAYEAVAQAIEDAE